MGSFDIFCICKNLKKNTSIVTLHKVTNYRWKFNAWKIWHRLNKTTIPKGYKIVYKTNIFSGSLKTLLRYNLTKVQYKNTCKILHITSFWELLLLFKTYYYKNVWIAPPQKKSPYKSCFLWWLPNLLQKWLSSI